MQVSLTQKLILAQLLLQCSTDRGSAVCKQTCKSPHITLGKKLLLL